VETTASNYRYGRLVNDPIHVENHIRCSLSLLINSFRSQSERSADRRTPTSGQLMLFFYVHGMTGKLIGRLNGMKQLFKN